MKSSFTNWARTSLGLEKIFLQEAEEKFGVKEYTIKHKSVFFDVNDNVEDENTLCTFLRTADDIYKFMGYCNGIDHTKTSTERIVSYFEKNILPSIKNFKSAYVRITVSFLGTRNFNRFYIENALNDIVASQTKSIILSNEKGDKWNSGEKRIRIHLEDDEAYFGIGLQDKPLHRREWRVKSYPAQLHPPLAAAMSMIAKPRGTTIIDPFCGSGTILIESALQHKFLKHIGFDVNKEAIEIARENSILAGVEVEFRQEDFYNYYKSFDNYFIITNPPWGEKHAIDLKHENEFFEKLLATISKSKGAVILIPEDLISNLKARKITLTEIFQTRIRGKLATVIIIR